ncbi:MAG: hypothetical protein HOD63_08895 [Bacteroidetes bacterium]|jgi:hypothetical protein|nr:hypothetical protein [Bacteroidota bacterium]MBT5527576.1 hypothetical protein [Cytophagia bacterium]MBT3424747.1 hypothetical protein [Bacteroidota bacterium]MBT3802698.1 hypothetical protein [Bacteroidota bacterium]MBT4338695.1 hypothetical protein [Bacteroidota bacterium]
MIIDNKTGRAFGPAAIFAGYIVFIAGFFFSWFAPIVVLIGASMAFSFKGTRIDTENKRYKSYTKIAGLFRHGKWADLSVMDEILINTTVEQYGAWSQTMRSTTFTEKNVKVVMQGETTDYSVPVKQCKTKELAIQDASKLSKLLHFRFETE